jgi:tetratricopeptide (TPR) repeat protein
MKQEFKTDSSKPSRHMTPAEQLISRIGGFALLVFFVYIVSDLSSIVLIQFGNAQFAAGKMKLGSGSYTLALELKPGLKKVMSQCDSDLADQQYESAIEHCSNAIKINRYHASAFYNRGVAYHNLEQNDQAIADFTKAIQLIPVYTRAYISRGFSYIPQGQSDLAIADCNKAIELDEKDASTYPSAYQCLGMAFYVQENYDSALANFEKAIELDTTNPVLYFWRGAIHSRQGKIDLAIADFTKAIELDPNYMDPYVWRGNAFADTQKFTQAIEDYKKALEISSDPIKDSYTYCALGVTYVKMNDFESAIASLEQGVKLSATTENDWCKSALEAARQGIPAP